MKPGTALLLAFLLLALSSCHVRKRTHSGTANLSVREQESLAKTLKQEIDAWLGVPYRMGGNDRQGIDCSGFVCTIYQRVMNISLPRTCTQQYQSCVLIRRDELQPGDLVFFKPGTTTVSHVGIYLGEGRFAHASVSKGVVISDLNNRYYTNCYYGAGRWRSAFEGSRKQGR